MYFGGSRAKDEKRESPGYSLTLIFGKPFTPVGRDLQSQVFETLVACRLVEQFKENHVICTDKPPMRVEQKTMSH